MKTRRHGARGKPEPNSYQLAYTRLGVPESPFHGTIYSLLKNEAQYIVTQGHPFRMLGKVHNMDIGGPFESKKIRVNLGKGCDVRRCVVTGRRAYEGTVLPIPDANFRTFLSWCNEDAEVSPVDFQTKLAEYTVPSLESDSSLDAWGTSVINSVVPTTPVADVAVSIGELLSERRFFSLPGTSGSVPGEYLNYMFGIAPTIGLAQDLRKAIAEGESLLKQLARDSGRLVRRRYQPEPEVTSERVVTPGVRCDLYGDVGFNTIFSDWGTHTLSRKTTKQWGFSGAFTYHFPEEGIGRTIAELDYLYGVRPGAALAWELLPFSWLLDYKLSIGDVLGNLDNFSQDGLVMPYGYVTLKTTVEEQCTWEGRIYNASNQLEHTTVSATMVKTTMQRRPATPFGFGINPGDLSARQLSIIAALGLSRL